NGLESIHERAMDPSCPIERGEAETVDFLLYRAEHEFKKALARPLHPTDVWSRLRRPFAQMCTRQHDPIVASITRLLPGPDAVLIEQSIDQGTLNTQLVPWLKTLKDDWYPCQHFLDNIVLPDLVRLKDILMSEEANHVLGPATVVRLVEWVQLIEGGSQLLDSDFTRLIDRISRDPDTILERRNWEIYRSEVEWLWKVMFRPSTDDCEPALFITFLEMVPVALGPIFMDACDALRFDLGKHRLEGAEDVKAFDGLVFCTSELLRETFHELLMNCDRYRHPADQEIIIRVSVTPFDHDNKIRFTVRNNGTQVKKKKRPGQGLNTLRNRLQGFYADLRSNQRPSDGWSTFEVHVLFQRGVGVSQ
ncbi:MAG: hypothetical protein MN733_14540, partial [Nitrososphaera sp.]|nr:hypothetical protein [Nitrososphaera sp.]